MTPDFWRSAWDSGRIGFHRDSVHPDLVAHGPAVLPEPPATVLVPLCGKSHDLIHLRDRGHEVIGVELVERAVRAFHEEQGIEPTVEPLGAYTAYRSPGLTILQGDALALTHDVLGTAPTAVWDRAAMVALPPELRRLYVACLKRVLAPGARLLVNVFDYSDAEMSGPPFCVPEDEVRDHYAGAALELLDRRDMAEAMSRPDRPLTRFEASTWRVTLP